MSDHNSENTKPRRLGWKIFKLTRDDLLHEWILTVCLILAVSAALSPLMILFGLKYGTIETLRQRLIQDPRNREIRPAVSRSFSKEWFAEIEKMGEVAFIIPKTRDLSASVDAVVKGSAKQARLDVIPTSEGDSLILENGSEVPRAGECVLTASAAEALGAKKGDDLVIKVKRLMGSELETGRLELHTSGILDERASTLKLIFVPLALLEDIEQFKDGQAVPKYGWSGQTPSAYPVYGGLYILLPNSLSKLEEIELTGGTGFTQMERLTPKQLFDRAGCRLTGDRAVYSLYTLKKPVDAGNLKAVQNRLRGKEAVIMPWVDGLEADILDNSGQIITRLNLLALAPASGLDGKKLISPYPPWDGRGKGASTWRKIILPAGLLAGDSQVKLKFSHDRENLVFPVEVAAEHQMRSDTAYIPDRLAGILNLFRERMIRYEPLEDSFIFSRRGYPGFRLYAQSIDQVDALRRFFEEREIPVYTQAERIRDVRELDFFLTMIFWLIAVMVMVGGMASLVASLYASVERKRKELSVLRLIGLSGTSLIRFSHLSRHDDIRFRLADFLDFIYNNLSDHQHPVPQTPSSGGEPLPAFHLAHRRLPAGNRNNCRVGRRGRRRADRPYRSGGSPAG